MTNRVNQIRGPVIIDGGVSAEPASRSSHNPLMLPGETNLPLADGTLGTVGDGRERRRDRSPTTNATNVNAATGERPGFDPRMNDFPYTTQFLSGVAAGVTLDVGSVSQDILSVGNDEPFAVTVTQTATGEAAPTSSSARPTSRWSTRRSPAATSRRSRSSQPIQWIEAQISLDRPAERRRRLDADARDGSGVVSRRTRPAGDAVPSRVALQLASRAARLERFTVRRAVGLLGDSRLLISRPGGRSRRVRASWPPPAPTANGTRDRQRHADDGRRSGELDDGAVRHRHGRRSPATSGAHRWRPPRNRDGRHGRRRRRAHDEARAGLPVRLQAARLRHPGDIQDRLAGRHQGHRASRRARRRVRRQRRSTSTRASTRRRRSTRSTSTTTSSPANDNGILTETHAHRPRHGRRHGRRRPDRRRAASRTPTSRR